MGYIHLNVLCNDLIKGLLWHVTDLTKRVIQIDCRSKTKMTLYNIEPAGLSRKFIDILKQPPVNRLQSA